MHLYLGPRGQWLLRNGFEPDRCDHHVITGTDNYDRGISDAWSDMA
jgi:hypothetical protein